MDIGKWILAAFGVVVVVVLIAVPTAILLNDDKTESQRTFTLEDYFNGTGKSKSYNMRWVSDDEYIHKTGEGSLHLINAATGNGSEFVNQQIFSRVAAFDYMVSADRKYVCFLSNYTKLWRHSYTASYSIYDLEKSDFVNTDIPHEVQYLEWSPTGHKLAFVWEYNVYVKETPTSAFKKVTTDGAHNLILNGIPDWVYEEEMFSTNFALWWSPNGRFVAYAKFNDSEVHNIEYSWYGEGQYPETVFIPYPKAGTPNPTVKLFVFDTNSSMTNEVLVPSAVGEGEHYLSTVTWASEERVAVQWQKRTQNYVILQTYDFNGTAWLDSSLSQTITSSTGWVGHFSPDQPVFRTDGGSCYYVMSDSAQFKHLVYFSGTQKTFLTSGNWEVTSILKVTKDAVYFLSNEHNASPGQRNVYKITINGASHSERECLTCTLNEERCKYNSAMFSTEGTYYLMSCSGPGLPLYTLRNSQDGTEVRVLEDNRDLENNLQSIAMPSVTHGTLKIGEFELWYQMTLPPNFDKSNKYPLLIDVYAGPCSQKSDFRFRVGWSTYLASTEKVIVASFDGRGSGYQGDKIMHALYKRLGTYEVEDQITATRQFIDMGFIDKDRVAIWGWSYGGYVTSMVMGAGSGVFKCGMAVAPVSKWEYYDSIYTERYMLTPAENQAFYDNSTVMGRAKNFKSVKYLLVHGTADDNVHFQQSAQISNALVDEQVDFDAMWYTDEDHGLGGSANQHVYTHLISILLSHTSMMALIWRYFGTSPSLSKHERFHPERGLKALEPKEAVTMKAVQYLAGLLLLLFVQLSICVPLQDDSTSTETVESLLARGQGFTTAKRHSEGTFSNDYSKYLETRRAQDFVQWLMNSKRNGGSAKRHAEGTYTSDVSSYLQDQAAQNFVAWLKSGQPKQDVANNRGANLPRRRHVDGSFTSDVNKVLDSIAAKEYLQWVMNSKTSGTSGKRGGNQ
ncbi:hypothetical protein QQF64_019345 [Cirrhinus molitorella]|uniref:Glucagon / GIP / secretin / VIP family domain-containing protein n=1 Tax=Cirrhinus molitorella TaxID=172907 RepID=A0ABR3LIJ0_9TELE